MKLIPLACCLFSACQLVSDAVPAVLDPHSKTLPLLFSEDFEKGREWVAKGGVR